MSAYAELAVTSNFSFLRGASHAEEMVEQAQELGLAGLGIADRNTVAGVVRAHTVAKEKGLRLAVGARLVFADGTPDILAYPRDRAGWGRLTQLLTVGKTRAEKGECQLFLDDLIEYIAGLNLIVMPRRITSPRAPEVGSIRLRHSKCQTRVNPSLVGEVARRSPKGEGAAGEGAYSRAVSLKNAPHPDPLPVNGERELVNLLRRLKQAASRRSVWLAAGMLYRGDDGRRLARLKSIASEAMVPLIAVNDVLYHAPERRPLQDVITCIREHLTLDAAGRRLEANAERHLKSAAEMARLFRAAPQAVEETARFIERCAFSLDELKYEYPDETRAGYATPQEALAAFAEQGARERYPQGVPATVREALDKELAIIGELNYAPYFLTVQDIVRFAKSKGILCQGRGSAANSVICYCLGVTEVDPQRIDLLFERFVSAERREPPDIDVDFEHERREEVIQYIYRKYSRERAGLAATVICYRGRSAIREVGKAFGLSEDTITALASTLWGWSMEGVTEKEARRAGLDPSDPRLMQVIQLAQELKGFPRHLSQHVGGFVITRSRLDHVVPIENAAMDDRTVVEWDKDDLNDLGILKVDVLGLGMLSCLRRAFDLLKGHYVGVSRAQRSTEQSEVMRCRPGTVADSELGTVPDQRCTASRSALRAAPHPGHEERIPLDLASLQDEDPAVYRMIQRADTIGVFQIESRAQMSMLPRLRPKEFYDLVIEVAIVRPGPIQGDMVHPYLRRRQGLEPVTYPSKELEEILKKTLGVPLFQEHAMRIAIVAAGFAPAEADRLRRAMATFKRVGTIDSFRKKFIDGMLARGYARDFAERCFSQIEGFGEYGFPESHAASFANLVYASSWIKCHYPDVFAAALLNSQPMGFYAPAQIVRDAQEHGVEVRPADVNLSDWDCGLEPLIRRDKPASSVSPLPLGEVDARSAAGEGLQSHDRPEPPHPNPLPTGERELAACWVSAEVQNNSCIHPRHASMQGDIRSTHALRLGLRQINGLSEKDARIIESVRGRGFDSVRDLWLRTRLKPSVLERLAAADAFQSLGLDRREALWAVRALQRSGDKDDLPLFARVSMAELEPDADLPPMPPGQQVVEDYRHLSLSLKAHPVSLLRTDLDARGILRHEQLPAVKPGSRVTVAGLVLVRQRPGDAKAIFMTLEDETGIANAIIWLRTYEIFRPVVLGARMVSATGVLQNEAGVIHIIADHLEDLSPLLRTLSDDQPRLPALRPSPVDAVMPKGRNFH